eukprot:351579-Chlamydomonas_euryale.AAC.6
MEGNALYGPSLRQADGKGRQTAKDGRQPRTADGEGRRQAGERQVWKRCARSHAQAWSCAYMHTRA